jgi:hypothetical protein
MYLKRKKTFYREAFDSVFKRIGLAFFFVLLSAAPVLAGGYLPVLRPRGSVDIRPKKMARSITRTTKPT